MRKFLIVVDETPECMNAMRFAARRAQKTGGGVTPEFAIREGKKTEEVLAIIEEDADIGVLVLGAGEGEGPGPLVSYLVTKMGHRLPVPVTVVPGGMTLERIDAVC